MANEIAKKQPKFEELALAKVKEYQDAGMVLPPNFNPTNSLKKARFMLNDMKVNGKPVLEVCTEMSIVQCLLDSVAKGLDFSENQIYFIPRGNQMTTMESVYGRIVRAKRASKNYKPIVQYVHEGDEFFFGADVETGATKVFKHTTNLENLDKPIIAAYTYVTDNDGNTEVFIMTKREWLKSWTKSSNGGSVAKEFERDMIYRTIIKKSTKALVNANTNAYFSPNDEEDDAPLAGDRRPEVDEQSGVVESQRMDFEEATDAVVVEATPSEAKVVEAKVVEPTPTTSTDFENDEF